MNRQLKKEFIKMITWRKPFWKRLMCDHKWKGYKASSFYAYGDYCTEICEKCGAIKYDPVFWEYEGMGYK